MKRFIAISVIFFVLSVMAVPVNANSVQVYRAGNSGTSICTVDKNTPITVESEELTFDFRDSVWSRNGIVTASYEMNNISDSDTASTMAFALIDSINSFNSNTVCITANNDEIEYDVHYCQTIKNIDDFDIDYALSMIKTSDYNAYEETDKNTNRVILLLYTVKFSANEKINVSVSYDITATADMSNTPDYTYTYEYLLSPAENWADFGSLSITIYASEQMPYLIDSSVPMESIDECVYRASLEGLPDTELKFMMYSFPEITAKERVQVSPRSFITAVEYMFAFLRRVIVSLLSVIIAVIVIIAVVAVIAYVIKRKSSK